MQRRQGVDRRVIQLAFVAAAGEHRGEQIVAQVLQEGETRRLVVRRDGGGGEPLGAEPAGRGHEGVHPGPRQPRHGGVAQRRALCRGGARRCGCAFRGGGRVHQHQRGPAGGAQPRVGPGGGVAGYGLARRFGQAVGGQKGGARRCAVRQGRGRGEAGIRRGRAHVPSMNHARRGAQRGRPPRRRLRSPTPPRAGRRGGLPRAAPATR